MEKGPKPFQQVRAVDTVKIGGIYRDMRSIRGESVHSPRGDASGEVLKGGRGRDGGGPLLRVPVVDDVAPLARCSLKYLTFFLPPCQICSPVL